MICRSKLTTKAFLGLYEMRPGTEVALQSSWLKTGFEKLTKQWKDTDARLEIGKCQTGIMSYSSALM